MKNGFTLIELLVGVSIAAVLALVGLVLFTDLQKNGRDTKRKKDIDAVATALETRYTYSSSPKYPTIDDTLFANGIVPKPPGGTTEADYYYSGVTTSAGGDTFKICALLEKSTGNADADKNYINTNNGKYYCRSSQQ